MADVILPKIDSGFLENLWHKRLGRTDVILPEQATIDAYLNMGSIQYYTNSGYGSVSTQLNFNDGISMVFEREIIGSAGDAGFREELATVSVYNDNTLVGTIYIDRTRNEVRKFESDMDIANLTAMKPYLEAFEVFGLLNIYEIPSSMSEQMGYKQLHFSNAAAFPIYDALKNGEQLTMNPKISALPVLVRDIQEEKITYQDPSFFK
ncbi:MAG: hypothetical protein NDI94_07100 [Candidatus Woesearchaeota archaeon]|nr:hypothetical protein [Candidatus Woesearchaeota archaeon]